MNEIVTVPDIFGIDVFNEATMRQRLPQNVCGSRQLVEKPLFCQSKPHILHLRCSLCFFESAAAQGLWALPTPGRGMMPLHPAPFLTVWRVLFSRDALFACL